MTEHKAAVINARRCADQLVAATADAVAKADAFEVSDWIESVRTGRAVFLRGVPCDERRLIQSLVMIGMAAVVDRLEGLESEVVL